MPKIPTFAARGRPTAEVGSIKTNLKLLCQSKTTYWKHGEKDENHAEHGRTGVPRTGVGCTPG